MSALFRGFTIALFTVFLFCAQGLAANAASDDWGGQLAELKNEVKSLRALVESQQEEIASLKARSGGIEPAAPGLLLPPRSGSPSLWGARSSELPDISAVGNVIGKTGNDRDESDLENLVMQEAELAFQGYLYPGVRADIIGAYDRENGTYEAELEEAYISFLETPLSNLSVRAGKELLDVGKLNTQHPHHWNFVDRPAVLKSYFGEHGLTGQGANFSYLVPLPFFLQIDCGVWDNDASSHTHEGTILGFSEEMYTSRFWTSFEISEVQELELGISGVKGYGAHASEHTDRLNVGILDITYRHLGKSYERLLLQSEFFFLEREIPDDTLTRFGFYSFAGWRWNKSWDAGVRYDFYESPYPGNFEESFVSGILTYSLSETTKIRLQYRRNVDDDNDAVFLQVVFGLGPHAHPLE